MDVTDLNIKAAKIRMDLLSMIAQAKAGHTGGSLSNTDILVALYYKIMNHNPKNPNDPQRDRFIASKGHAVESLWCILADIGYFPKEELATFSQFGTRLIGHPNNKVPGIEMNTGALGHGLAISVGMALAGQRDQQSYRIFCLMGDGELAEGSIWEAAMAASHYQLSNIIGIIDANGLQITGQTSSVLNNEPLLEKWQAFGWHVAEIDGHNIEQLVHTLSQCPFDEQKPTLIIARTVKGKGISFTENQVSWHHRVPTEHELTQAHKELQLQIDKLKEGQQHELNT